MRTFEAHTDYIRSVAAHPVLPCLLTSSDDMLIKLWDWDKGWACVQVFEGHSHYVMQVRVFLCGRVWACVWGGVPVAGGVAGRRRRAALFSPSKHAHPPPPPHTPTH